MPLRAIAYHESISVGKLEEIFKSEWNELFGGTTFAHCPNCKSLYAVFIKNTDDKDNLGYVKELEKRIAADCNKGKHTLNEIRFNSTP